MPRLTGHTSAFTKILFEQHATGTDEIVVGESVTQTEDDVEAATMEDAAQLVDSVKYLVRGWIPFGMVTGVVAEPGVGKSAFALWLARSVMTGLPWFNGSGGPTNPSSVLWCPTENDMAITMSRMNDWGIPRSRMLMLYKADPLYSVCLTEEKDLARVVAFIGKYRPLLVVIDSLRGAHNEDENNSKVGQVMQKLCAIAESTKVAVVVVHHSSKLLPDADLNANSSRGSNAIAAYMRSMIGVDKPDPKSKWSRLRVLKENLGIAPEPVGMLVGSDGLEFGPAPRKPKREKAADTAEEWLRQKLQPGKSYPADEVLAEGQAACHQPKQVHAAKKQLGIKPRQVWNAEAKKNLWVWSLPENGEG